MLRCVFSHRLQQEMSDVHIGLPALGDQTDSIFMVCECDYYSHNSSSLYFCVIDGSFFYKFTYSALYIIFQLLEENIISFVKKELKAMQRVVSSQSLDDEVMDSKEEEGMRSSREAFLKIVMYFLRRQNQEELADSLQNSKMIFTALTRWNL